MNPRYSPSLLLSCALSVWAAHSAGAADFRIEEVSLTTGDRLELRFAPAADSYFRLLRGDSVTGINATVAVALAGPMTVPTPTVAGFFRLQQIPRAVALDSDGDGRNDVDELLAATDPLFAEPLPRLTQVAETSPVVGEEGVSVNRETILRFSEPLAAGTQIGNERLFAEFGSRRLLSRVELSGDRRQATLFYLEPLAGAARIRVTFASDGLLDAAGKGLDGDGDGVPGGTRRLDFVTAPLAEVPGTRVIGRVFASERVAAPGGGMTNRPLGGVTVSVDGAEERLLTMTDADGYFSLRSPAGRFFVHVDGRTAWDSAWPTGDYYPVIGKPFVAVPGRTNNLAGETGEMFLPLIRAGTLRSVSPTQPTTVNFPSAVLAEHPEWAGVSLTVPANALFADNGARGGRVGIAPVEPDRIPSPLPPGLALPLVITVQTDGPSNFSEPVAARFPNLPDAVTGQKLAPGAKSALWSFNHDTGRWEVQGSMTVSADGQWVETDPGVGIRQPGWHGSSPGGTGGGGGGGSPGPCQAEAAEVQDAFMGCMQGAFLELLELSPGLGCAVSLGQAAVSSIQDCGDPTKSCGGSLAYNALFGGLGCIPGVGTVAGYAQCAYELKTATDNMAACQAAQPAGIASASRIRRATNDDTQALQTALLDAQRALVLSVSGELAWLEAAAADHLSFISFGNQLLAALDPAGPEAARISPSERSALLALPAPNGLAPAQVAALVDRLDRFSRGGMTRAEQSAIEEASAALTAAANAATAAGWTTMLEGVLAEFENITQTNDEGFRSSVGGGTAAASVRAAAVRAAAAGGYGPVRSHELLYHLVDLRTGFTRRGRTAANGSLDGLITAVDTPYFLTYLDPLTQELGTTHFRSGGAGERYTLPLGLLVRASGADTDLDGLFDVAEEIAGTRPDVADTDGDGATDADEIRRGDNPLDGLALPQTVVASLPLGGSTTGISSDASAQAVCADGDLLFVANGKRGLAVVDGANPLGPVWLGELDLPGESVDVAYAPGTQVAGLVGSPEQFIPGERGVLHFVDVSDPAAPRLRQSHSLPAVAIDHWNGFFYVALGQFALKQVRIYEATSGLERTGFTTQDYATGLRVVGGRAYVATLSGLEIFDVRSATPNRLGRLAGDFTPETLGRAHLILEGTTLYISKRRGVAVVDVANPTAPQFVGLPSATTGAVRSLARTGGSRLLELSLGTPEGNPSSAGSLSVYDATNPTNTTAFLFGISTPGQVRDVVPHRGFAAVADGTRGLAIVNFADPDLNRLAPLITFDASALDMDATAPGVQAKAGSTTELLPVLRDDVQLTRVELLVDGAPVQSVSTYPAQFDLSLPASPGDRVSVQIRATDGAGNVGTSEPVPVHLLADTEAPVLVSSLPAAQGAAFVGAPMVFTFNEPLEATSLNPASIRLVHLGADAAVGGGDDVEFAPTEATARGSTLRLRLPDTLTAGRCQLTLGAGFATDSSGNASAQPLVFTFDLLAANPNAAVWVSDANGVWSNPANWLHGRVPSQDDEVILMRFGARPIVTLDVSAVIKSLRLALPFVAGRNVGLTINRDLNATEPVSLTSGNVTVGGQALFARTLTLRGSSLTVSQRLETRGLLTLEAGADLTLSGTEAQFAATGGVAGANFTFTVRDGAVIELPGLTAYQGGGDFTPLFPVGTRIQALGSGSKLTLSGMITAAGPVDWNVRGAPTLLLEAQNGGRLELPALTALDGRVQLQASGAQSVLTAPLLARVTGSPTPFTASIKATDEGRVQVPALTTISDCPITETGGGVVERP